MGLLNYEVADLLLDIADTFDEDVIDANSHHDLSRVTRVMNRTLKQIGRAYPMRMEEYVYTSDGTTELKPWPSDFISVEQILVNDIPMARVSYDQRIWSHPFLYWQDALVLGNYLRPDGIGTYPVPASGNTIRVIVRASLPTIRQTETAITSASWTNVSTTPVVSSVVSNVSPVVTASTFKAGNGILAPDDRVYTGLSSNATGDEITLTEPYRGSSVTGTSGAATIGGDIPMMSWWRDALLYKVTYELMKSEPDETRTGIYRTDWEDARDEAVTQSEHLYGERVSRSSVTS